MPWLVPPRRHWQSGRNAGRHESPRVWAVVTTTRRSPLIRCPPQPAASQISAAARIATKNTTMMTAAGIARSLWSCLCTSVPLALMAPGAARQASLEPLRWRLRLPRAALAVAEPTLVRSGVAPRALCGQVPGGPAGPACRAARRGWLGPGRRGLLPRRPAGRGFRPPCRATRARRRQGEPVPHGPCPVPGSTAHARRWRPGQPG
jgi:hypothetical protein